ncbi:MAG TPA: aldo/keto reductase [Verrucomicrobiae bacterium]
MKEKPFSASRRNFLKSTLTLPVALAAAPSLLTQSLSAAEAPADVLPQRELGKSGRKVTMLCMGGMMGALNVDYIDIAWTMGIRYFDTARAYLNGKSEAIFGAWLAKYPERRKEIFLVTKDHPRTGAQLVEMVEKRTAACGTSYLDAFFIHGLNRKAYGEDSVNWPKNDDFKSAVAKLKSEGKVKLVGFSTHDGDMNDYLHAAAEGGFMDMVMLKYNPFFQKGDAFDQALEAAHKAGIGLVAMKTMRDVQNVSKRLPEFDKLNLTTHQAKLHACWSDPRIAAVCVNIENVDQMTKSAEAARSYKGPLKMAHMDLLKETMLASRRTMCTGCPACAEFSRQTNFAFDDIARYVTYYEQDGNTEARDYYRALAEEQRDASKIDLAALRDACHFKTDYPEIVKRAEKYFA